MCVYWITLQFQIVVSAEMKNVYEMTHLTEAMVIVT